MEFQEGEHVVTPKVGVGRSTKFRKLNPHFLGLFQILILKRVALGLLLTNSLSTTVV